MAEDSSTVTETMEIEVKKTKPKTSSGTSSDSSTTTKSTTSYQVTVPLLNIRQKASLASEIIGSLQEGDIAEITTRTPQGFGKLADGDGYIKLEYAEKVEA